MQDPADRREPTIPEQEARPLSRKIDNARNLYLEGIRDGKPREAVTRYTGARYTQHSTGVRDGVEGFVAFFEPFIARNGGVTADFMTPLPESWQAAQCTPPHFPPHLVPGTAQAGCAFRAATPWRYRTSAGM